MERVDDVFHVVKFLGLDTKLLLYFEILLEIVVTKFLVDFEQVVELLDSLLIGFPHVGLVGGWHGANLLELLLQLLHAPKVAVDVVGVGGDGIDLLNDGFLLVEVGGTLGLKFGMIFSAFILDGTK